MSALLLLPQVIGQSCEKASHYTAYSVRFAQRAGGFIYPLTFQIAADIKTLIRRGRVSTVKDAININPQHREKKDSG